MHNYIIAYDIFDKKRLRKVKNIAYSYALGGQKSAVEAPLDAKSLKQLVRELKSVIQDDDKVNIIKVFSQTILLAKASQITFKKNGLIIL